MSDQRFLHAYATHKDPVAFRALVEAYQGLVYSAAGRRLARQQDIEDVVQLTFLKLAHAADTIRHDLASWLYSTAVNAANDLIRRDAARRRHEVQAAFTQSAAADPTSQESLHHLLHQVDEAILKLPIEQQSLIVEHFLRGRSQRDLATELGISQATICRRMEAAIRSLRQALGRHGMGAAPSMVVALLQNLPQPPVPPILTGQIVKIGLAGAGAKAGTLSLWIATLGGGLKVGIAATVLVLIAAGSIVGALQRRAPVPARQGLPEESPPLTPLPAQLAPAPRPPSAAGIPQLPVAESPSALVARIRRAYASIEPFATAITSTATSAAGESLTFSRLAIDGPRIDLRSDRFDRRGLALLHTAATRRIWDGDLEIARTTPPSPPSAAPSTPGPPLPATPARPADLATFSRDPRSRLRLLAARDTGPFLAGYLQGRHLADILENATSRQAEFAMLDDMRCQLISGTGALGAFQFWIDDRTALLRKAILDQKSGDLHWNERLPRDLPPPSPPPGPRSPTAAPASGPALRDAILGCHVELTDLRIVAVGDKFVPMQGTVTETLTYRTRASEVIVETATRTEFRHRPDFAALRAFQMDGLSTGQRITREILSPRDAEDTTFYLWQDGKILPAIVDMPAPR